MAEIKYFITNLSNATYHCIVEQRNICQRESNDITLPPNTQNWNFYSSVDNIICSNTYGTWRFLRIDYKGPWSQPAAYFEVEGDIPGAPGVNITIKADGSIDVSGQVKNVTYSLFP